MRALSVPPVPNTSPAARWRKKGRHPRRPPNLTRAVSNHLSDAEVESLREDTPGVRGVTPTTKGGIAHFNAAGSSLPPRCVLDAQVEYLQYEATHGGYETTEDKSDALQLPYTALATLLNCSQDEIAISQSATSAWQMAFGSLLNTFNPGDRVLTARCEYASNYINYLQAVKEKEIVIEVVPSDEYGQLDVGALEEMLTADRAPVKLVSITHIPTSGGLINDAAAIGKLTKKHDVPFLLDACQSVGQMPVDVEQLRCDFLVGTGRKYLRGPRGIGFLYARKQFINKTKCEPMMLDLHGARWDSATSYVPAKGAKRFEQYEVAFCAKAGLGVAVEYALALGVERTWQRMRLLAEELRKELQKIQGVTVCDVGENKCGIVTFDVLNVSVEKVRTELHSKHGVNVWTSRICNNTRMEWEGRKRGKGKDDLPSDVVRASVAYFNEGWEIDRLVKGVEEIAKKKRAEE